MHRDPEVLKQLCDHATVALDADGAALCLVDASGRVAFVAASDDQAARVGSVQSARSESPAAQACRSGRLVVVDDVASAECPQLRGAARDAGVSSMVALPIVADEAAIGALDVYRAAPGTWSRRDLWVGRAVTEIAAVLMSQGSDLDRAEAMIEQLRDTLDNRAVIEQAKGMIARDHQVPVPAAFEALRRHSRNTNTPLRALARAVTELGLQVPMSPDDRRRWHGQRDARTSVATGTSDFGTDRS